MIARNRKSRSGACCKPVRGRARTPFAANGVLRFLFRFWATVLVVLGFVASVPVFAAGGIGLAQQAGSVRPNADGTFSVDLMFIVQNVGDENLLDVQLENVLSEQLGQALLVRVANLRASGALTQVRPNFNGLTESLLLSGDEPLPVGTQGIVEFTLVFNARGFPGPFPNSARALGTAQSSGVRVEDLSTDGVDPDPDTPGNEPAANPAPQDNDQFTLLALPSAGAPISPQPIIGLAKTAGPSLASGSGLFTSRITLVVQNLGATELIDIEVRDNLVPTFDGAIGFRIVEAPSASGGLQINPSYDGVDDIGLLGPNARLALGAQSTITFVVEFEPGAAVGPFNNSAFAWANSPTNGGTDDFSTDGFDPDPNGNGDPTDPDESTPTPIIVPEFAQIGLAKAAGDVVFVEGSDPAQFTVDFNFVVSNVGETPLTNVQIVDDLSATFAEASGFAVVAPPTLTSVGTTDLIVNAAFDGATDPQLLAQGSQLDLGEQAVLAVTVSFTPSSEEQLFLNSAQATGFSPQGDQVTDVSTDGLQVDPNGDGLPDEDEPTPVQPPALPPTDPEAPEDELLGTISGTVFFDPDLSSTFGAGEQPLAGWVVQVFDSAGTLIAEVATDVNGEYQILDLPADEYQLSFSHPESGATWQQSVVSLPAGGAAVVDLPVVVAGRVYASLTRELVPNTTLRVVNADSGQELPPACLLPGQQNQTVGSDAAFRFDVQSGADPLCPAGLTNYRIDIVSTPIEFITAPSTLIPSQNSVLSTAVCLPDANSGPPCVVQQNALPPTLIQNTDYFLSFSQALGDPVPVHNHIPLDIAAADGTGNLVAIQKTVGKSEVVIGDIVPYRVQVDNLTTVALSDVVLQDTLPPGFVFVATSAELVTPGIDGQLLTADDVRQPLATQGSDVIDLGPFTVPPESAVAVEYLVRVGVGITQGEFVNRVVALINGVPIGLESTAVVEVVADPLFEQTSILGKVFQDRDGDNWQDPANATGLVVSGGPFTTSMQLPSMRARRAATDPPMRVQLPLPDGSADFAGAIELVSAQGSRVSLLANGEQRTSHRGDVAAGRSSQALSMRVLDGEGSDGGAILLIENEGIAERGLPGVQLATVGGLLIETDAHGRYHIADVDAGKTLRGANFILKLDLASLPDGSEVVGENPRVLRITQALASRIDFGVLVPDVPVVPAAATRSGEMLEIVTRGRRAEVRPVRFGTGKAKIPDDYAQQLRGLLAKYEGYSNLRLTFVGHADPRPLRGRLQEQFTDNVGLSRVRAKEVAEFARSALDLPAELVQYEGRGSAEPVATNSTVRGLALNRRVEIEVSWTETNERQFSVATQAADLSPGVEEATYSHTEVLQPIRFDTGVSELDAASVGVVRRAIERYGVANVRLNLVGHTDNVPLGDARKEQYGSNQRLSELRAEAVADQLRSRFGLARNAVSASGRGDQQPIATNATVAGRAQNRRVDVELVTQQNQTTELRWLRPLQVSETDYLPHGGRIWASEHPLVLRPALDVLATSHAASGDVANQHNVSSRVSFTTYSNYANFIDRVEVRLYAAADTDRVRPLAVIEGKSANSVIDMPADIYAGLLAQVAVTNSSRDPAQIAYVLRAYGHSSGATGASVMFDETAPRLLQLANQERRPAAESVWGQNNLSTQRIPVQGSRVRVHGIDVDPAMRLRVEGERVPVGDNGSFVWEQQMPVGEHQLKVELTDSTGARYPRTVPVRVDGNYQFVVGLANLTVGQNNIDGNLEPLSVDDRFDGSLFVDGRLALYAKAKIRGKYLLTAQLDSTEDELRNFGRNLRREDPRALFRQLDPDLFYPVYGDDSTTSTDVDTQGAFYVRLEFDGNEALWGNYNTGLTDTEFQQFNRSLYGAKLRHESRATTRYGDAKRELTLFGSEAESAAAHVTFAATGGSLYYLRNTDIVQGSEKVYVEVRRRDSTQVLDREILYEGRDYEIDAVQGRIILARPLSQVVSDRGQAIIRSTPLEGDDVFLLVDYEYVPENFTADEITAGGRGRLWLGDHVAVGVTKVIDERAGNDYDLEGVDIQLKAGQGTYLRAEYARSEAQQNLTNFASADGGLSFDSQGSVNGPDVDGEAIAIEARVNLAEVNPHVAGDVRVWWQDRDAEFSSGRLSEGVGVEDAGIDAHVKINDQLEVNASYNRLERGGIGTDQIARVQVDGDFGRFSGGLEARFEDVEREQGASLLSGTTGSGEALLLGGRLGYELSDVTELYAVGQLSTDERGDYEDNDLISVGVNTALSDAASVSLELSDGDRGSAIVGGVDLAATGGLRVNAKSGFGSGAISQFGTSYSFGEGQELYGSYSVDPDRTLGARDLITLGQRRQFGNSTKIFTETQFGKDDIYSGASHVFGVDFSGIEDWLLSATLQRSDNENLGADFERSAASVGARLERTNYQFSSRLEYREDQAPGLDQRQYLTSNAFNWRQSDAHRWQVLFNFSLTEDEVNNERDARFIEADLGYAYRPTWSNRLNVLARYSFLFDLPSEGQATGRVDQQSHIGAIEALYDLNNKWELGVKLAIKEGEQRLTRNGAPWFDFGLRLAVVRARYHLTNKWDGVAEYRWLADSEEDGTRSGGLLGAYRHIGRNLKLGVGYNYAGFDDDLRFQDFDNHGWFIDLVGKY